MSIEILIHILWTSPSPTPKTTPELPPLPSGTTGISFGIGDWITNQINAWFADLVGSAIKPLLDALAATLLATPSIDGQTRIEDLWHATLVIANGSFILFATVGGILAMSYESVQTRYAIKEILPRLVVAFLSANASFLLAGKAIDLGNAIAQALLGQGFDARRAANAIRLLVLLPDTSPIFYILLALVAVVLLVVLLITFVLRVALTTLLVVAAPLALACHALPQTDGLARLWWRVFTGLLLIQICQSLTLVTAVRVFFNQDGREVMGLTGRGPLYNLLLALVLLIILVRIPTWVSRAMFLPGGRGLGLVRIVKYAVAYKLTSPLLNVLHLRKGAKAGTARRAATTAIATRALPALVAGPAGTAAASAATAATAAAAACGGAGPAKHAPVFARRPVNPANWQPSVVKHAPSAPPVQGKYRPTPAPSRPVPPSTPVFGYPRDNYYAAGPAGLNQMYRLRSAGTSSPPPPRQTVVPPAAPRRPVQPIVPPDAPVPGSVDWPENPGRRKPPPRRRTRGQRGGDGR
ncbi:conjugal transfer protein TrbL family protein [Microbispora sp. H10885]|uniref:conjugal transfer protein TrbL family protein n=1 Tax=Microbispora sp. H10885 TaxID=2729110 RepID=UPI001604588D|nr:conjugal transfer protein TrbL family protein [Microbispora sp. H10885]